MSQNIPRRAIITGGGATGAAMLGTFAGVGFGSTEDSPLSRLPWPYLKLDPVKTRDRAYASFFKGGCMYGVFEAVAAQVAEGLGQPYTHFPFELSFVVGAHFMVFPERLDAERSKVLGPVRKAQFDFEVREGLLFLVLDEYVDIDVCA